MTIDETEAIARAVVAICASPGARDVARFERGKSHVAIHFIEEPVELDFERDDFFAEVSLLKRTMWSITGLVRARAMLDAAGDRNSPPLWMLTTSRFVGEWVRWSGVSDRLGPDARWAEDTSSWPQFPKQVEVSTTHRGRHMALAAMLYEGELTGAVALSSNPLCRFSWSRKPEIRIGANTLPEAVITALLKPELEGANQALRLSQVVSHPFFDVYDPVVTGIANDRDNGMLLIGIDDETTTIEPVPTAAMRILPPDADPARPWIPSPSESQRLRYFNPMDFEAASDC